VLVVLITDGGLKSCSGECPEVLVSMIKGPLFDNRSGSVTMACALQDRSNDKGLVITMHVSPC
jgi:hypothetical protein